jgi:chemotaxis protein MotB
MKHGRNSQDRWLVSYADLMTLLFAFFTVMYGISTVDADKLGPAASSFQTAFSSNSVVEPIAFDGGTSLSPSSPVVAAEAIMPTPASNLGDVRQRLSVELADAIGSGRLEIVDDPRGLVLSLPVEATFATGSADVQRDALTLIGRLAATVGPLGNALRIEGHTDDVPIRTARYGSNWELSTARASAVVAFLIAAGRIEPARLSAAGYGEFHPRVPNDSAGNRARNRRVDIVVLNSVTGREEPPSRVPASGAPVQ